jgi:hypothetical protein
MNIPSREVSRLPVIAEAIFCTAVISMPSVFVSSLDETIVSPANASSVLARKLEVLAAIVLMVVLLRRWAGSGVPETARQRKSSMQ